jgi:hypothetical protein
VTPFVFSVSLLPHSFTLAGEAAASTLVCVTVNCKVWK